MPTIQFQLKDLQQLTGRKISATELNTLIELMKGELDNYDSTTDEVTVSLDDTNVPYLWSVEGVSRCIKNYLAIPGEPLILHQGKTHEILVDPQLRNIRPYIAGFIARGNKINNYMLKQMIQLQEKLSEGYGCRRKKIAIGIYQYPKIKFPIYYRATDPDSVKFAPLDFKTEMTQTEILDVHPKGKEYAKILEGYDKYPLLIDSAEQILSFPPIINSEGTGKIKEGDSELFIEVTGTDHSATILAINILAYAFHDRGFVIEPVLVRYAESTEETPRNFNQSLKVNPKHVENVLGLAIDTKKIKTLLEKAGYSCTPDLSVTVPDYRQDVMHEVDVIEDICIMFGYENIPSLEMHQYTQGTQLAIMPLINNFRELVIGQGYQEIMSTILTNKELLYDLMNLSDFGTVEIKEYMSQQHSVVRSWLLPGLMSVLSKNKHAEYPQKIFEQGLVTTRKGENIEDFERIAILSCGKNSDFTEIKQMLDYTFNCLDLAYGLEDANHQAFIPGRVGRIIVQNTKVGYIGEINPKVLENFGLDAPTAAAEINVTEIHKLMNKKH